jgi:hypothetical protein
VATVSYPVSFRYRAVPNMRGLQPAAEVQLFNGAMTTRAVGIFDSGSSYTVFSPELAEVIGIDDVMTGRPEGIGTLGGPIRIYLFDLEIQLLGAGSRFAGQIGFFATHAPRNILGRSVIFSAFEVGFHERGQVIYLRAES